MSRARDLQFPDPFGDYDETEADFLPSLRYSRVRPDERVMVALLPQPRDWYLLRDQGWYRIPCKTQLRHDYRHLAFYFGDESFRKKAWQICWWATIESREIKPRRELLPDEADNAKADLLYFKLSVGELRPLQRPILSRRARKLVFVPTTLDKLCGADELNDLWHESPLEDALWQTLREHGIPAERQWFLYAARSQYCLDFAVFCERGGLDIECDGDSYHANAEKSREDNLRNNALTSAGWAVLRFNTEQIIHEMPACLRTIRATIAQRGGAHS